MRRNSLMFSREVVPLFPGPMHKQAGFIRQELPADCSIDILVRTSEQIKERIKLDDFSSKRLCLRE